MTTAEAMPYQRAGVRAIEAFGGRALLADEMGLGKTLQALWFLRRQRAGPTAPAVVVCPAAVKYMWEHEAAKHVGLHAHVIEGTTPPPAGALLTAPPPLTVINYDILRHWVPWLQRLGPQVVILDECQYIANRRTKRTRAVQRLCRGVPQVLALSGTPLTNRPSELWPTLNTLRPDLYPSFFTYAQEFCDPRKAPWGWEFKGATNLPRLHQQLRERVMVRRLKADVLADLPQKVRRVVPMELADRDEYELANRDFRAWLLQHAAAKFATATRAEQLTKIGYLLRLTARLKLANVAAWANRWLEETGEKLVLFAVHKAAIKGLRELVDAEAVVVDGSITGRHRQAAVDRFRTNPNTRVFIGNIKAAGTGIDGLQEAASTMAFAELWWRPGDHVQAEDRLHRMGQDARTWVNYLVAGGTIEETLCQIIQTKQQTIRSVLDGGTPAGTGDDLNVLDQLLTTLATGGTE
jgi:SWI/SNF-related matrix-associated actin-dependent regulator 1 of chromatin subfamily A